MLGEAKMRQQENLQKRKYWISHGKVHWLNEFCLLSQVFYIFCSKIPGLPQKTQRCLLRLMVAKGLKVESVVKEGGDSE